MNEFEQAVIETALDAFGMEYALGLGNPAQTLLKEAQRKHACACSDLLYECEGRWQLSVPDTSTVYKDEPIIKRRAEGKFPLLDISGKK